MALKSNLLESLQSLGKAKGKSNYQLLEPYLDEIDSSAGMAMKNLASKLPQNIRKQLSQLSPFELYCFLRALDDDFPSKRKRDGQQEAGN